MKKNIIRFIATVVVVLAVSLPLAAFAAVPATLGYQGKLTDKSGNPITASKTLVFSLYNVATGGAALWTETQTLTVTSGHFGTALGVVTPLDVSMFGGSTWLGIAVQGEPEMTPRQSMTSVAYAMKAGVADSVSSSNSSSIIPPGTVVAFAGSTAPAGWLLCDGASVVRTTYATLFTAIGTAHGTVDSTHFNLPDYRGRFLRGVDGTAGNDPDKTTLRTLMNPGGNAGNLVGSVQGDAVIQHNHTTIGPYSGVGGGTQPYGNAMDTSHIVSTGNYGGSETRPKNAYVNWIIKY